MRGQAGSVDDERHAHLFVIQCGAVVAPAVLVEFFAVIRRHHDDGVGALLLQIHDHPAHHGVAIGNLAVVTIDVAAAEVVARVRLIGLMRLE
jgi:hypothetical protein